MLRNALCLVEGSVVAVLKFLMLFETGPHVFVLRGPSKYTGAPVWRPGLVFFRGH